MKNKLVSVVIPAYNRLDSLIATLKSVVSQTHSRLEILVIDDGSDLDLSVIIDMFNDERIIYRKLEHCNANIARNYGIALSTGEYIAMLDSDDIWLNNHIEECLVHINKSRADGLYGSLFIQDDGGNKNKFIVREVNKDETMIDYILSTGFGAQTSTLFLSSQSAKHILWNSTLRRHQDYDFVVRYSKEYIITAKKEPTVIYTLNSKYKEIDFESCIRFIEQNKNEISPQLYIKYNLGMLKLATASNAELNIIKYYKNEATYYKEYLSYLQYVSIMDSNNIYDIILSKCRYIWSILKIKVIC